MSVRIAALGDLHGKFPRMRSKGFDYILSVGDFCPNLSRDLMFEDLRKRLEEPGYQGEWWDSIGIKEAERRNRAEMERGRKVLEKIASYGKPVMTVPGNTDFFYKDSSVLGSRNYYRSFLLRGLRNVKDAHMKAVTTPFFTVIGYGGTHGPEVPVEEERKLFTKSELGGMEKDLRKLEKEFDRLFHKAGGENPVIFLVHNVPYGTSLDKIRERNSPRFGQHFGSVLARRVIEKHQPLICLGGHMHKGRGACYIGDTLCINLGEGSDAILRFEIDGMKLDVKKLGSL